VYIFLKIHTRFTALRVTSYYVSQLKNDQMPAATLTHYSSIINKLIHSQ